MYINIVNSTYNTVCSSAMNNDLLNLSGVYHSVVKSKLVHANIELITSISLNSLKNNILTSMLVKFTILLTKLECKIQINLLYNILQTCSANNSPILSYVLPVCPTASVNRREPEKLVGSIS